MLNSDIIKVKIKNWDKYQTRKDLKSMNFFRLQSDIFYDEKMLSLKSSEKLLFLCLLAETARTFKQDKHEFNTSSTQVNIKMIRRLTCFHTKTIKSCLIRLEQFQLLSIENRDELVSDSCSRVEKSRVEKSIYPEKAKKPTKTSLKNKQKTNGQLSSEFTQAKALRAQIWKAYSLGYERKYKVPPVRNAKANALVKQLHDRLGKEAIGVVEYYLQHDDSFYIKRLHDLSLCVKDAEALHTQFKSKTVVNDRNVREFTKELDKEKAFEKLLQEAREEDMRLAALNEGYE